MFAVLYLRKCQRLQSPVLVNEPTVGVDPVSRRELWAVVNRFVQDEGTTVLLSTAYLDEAERCDEVIMLDEGQLTGQGPPSRFSEPLDGRTFKVWIPERKNRDVQELLAGQVGVTDAVIQGDAVRLVLGRGVDRSYRCLEKVIAILRRGSRPPVETEIPKLRRTMC